MKRRELLTASAAMIAFGAPSILGATRVLAQSPRLVTDEMRW